MDQCTHCSKRGKLEGCKQTPCSHHESWYAMEMIAEAERNREAIAELVAALAPFAGMMDDAEHLSRRPDGQPVFAINNYGFTVGDLRNARAAITKHTQPTKKGSN